VAACGSETAPNLVDLATATSSPATTFPFASMAPTPLATEPPTTPAPSVPIVEAEPPKLAVHFTSLTSPINPGGTATAKVKTASGAKCTIEVEYKSGPSTAAGLGPKTAKATGSVSWSWNVGFNTSNGKWPVTVSCSKGDANGSAVKYLAVR